MPYKFTQERKTMSEKDYLHKVGHLMFVTSKDINEHSSVAICVCTAFQLVLQRATSR